MADSLPSPEESAEALAERPLAFYNALLTEHFVLESARGITVSESGSRSSLYLMTLSSTLVAFGFLASTPYALIFLATLIPIVFLLGVFTYVRLVQTALEDVAALASIQRIRRFYGTLLPGADRFFPIPGGSVPNQMLDIGQRGYNRGIFFTTASAVGVVNSLVGGVGFTLAMFAAISDLSASIFCGLTAAGVSVALHAAYQARRYTRLRDIHTQTNAK
jgi:hypothetical protein